MAASLNVDNEELELYIKSLLVSRPTVMKANQLLRECEDLLERKFPFRQLGFDTFVDYLRSIPGVVHLEPHNGYNPDVLPIASQASRHIDQLVSKQRLAPTKKRGVARRGGYNGRPPSRRRTTTAVSRPAPAGGRPTQRFDNRGFDSYRNGTSNEGNFPPYSDDTKGSHAKMDYTGSPHFGGSGAPNKFDARDDLGFNIDESDDFDDDEFYDDEKDSEEEMSKKTIQLWSRALGVEDNNVPPGSPRSVDQTSAGNSRGEVYDQSVELPDDVSNISSKMIINFREILTDHPDGILASHLQKLYFEKFRVTLGLFDLGYTSAISLASSLPHVFTYQREGSHDWKLFDARYITQKSLDAHESGGNFSLSENVRYIPQTIIDNIKKLLDGNRDGFRSTDLLQKYENTFRKPLNLEILGFNKLEEFLMILKNDITLKKALNCYILLPKHEVVSYEALEPPKADERLNVPAEALCVPIPDNVMRLGEEIPLQQLPPVQMDPDPNKPLLELEVRVAEVISPALFYIVLDSRHQEMDNMMDDLEKFYQWEEANYKIPLPHMSMDLFCATKFDGFWHRAKITRIKNHGVVEVEFIDFGTPGSVKSSELRYLSKEFSTLPAQAICAKLLGVKPRNGLTKFPSEVCSTFLELVTNKRLVAHVYEVTSRVRHSQERMQLDLILYDVENRNPEIVLNDYLIEIGFASPILQLEEPAAPTPSPQPAEDFIQFSDLISIQEEDSTMIPSDFSLFPDNDTTMTPSDFPVFPDNDSTMTPSDLPIFPENSSPSPLGSSSTALPVSSVNRFKNISSNLKRFISTRYASRDKAESQLKLKMCTTPESSTSQGEQTSCQSIPVANGSINGLVNGNRDVPIEIVPDLLAINDTLAKIKKKRKSIVFNPLKVSIEDSKSEPCLYRVTRANDLNSGVITNGTTTGNGSGDFCYPIPKSPAAEGSNGLVNGKGSRSLNESETPKKADCEIKLDSHISNKILSLHLETCKNSNGVLKKPVNYNSDKTEYINGNKCDVDVKSHVKEMLKRTNTNKLKNLFGIPTLPK